MSWNILLYINLNSLLLKKNSFRNVLIKYLNGTIEYFLETLSFLVVRGVKRNDKYFVFDARYLKYTWPFKVS